MEAEIYKIDGSVGGKVELPVVFSEYFDVGLVRRAILSEQSSRYQPQGHYLLAGMQTTAVYVGTYSGYRRGRHMGIAIRPRQKLGGGAMGDVRRIPSSVKGRRAHQHKIEKRIEERINREEYKKAMASAIGGSSNAEMVNKAYAYGKKKVPIIVENGIEGLSKTADVVKALISLGISDTMEASHKPRLRRGLRRGIRMRHFRKGVLIVVKDGNAKIGRAARNIPGVDIRSVKELDVESLAPGAKPRLEVWSAAAVEELRGGL